MYCHGKLIKYNNQHRVEKYRPNDLEQLISQQDTVNTSKINIKKQ